MGGPEGIIELKRRLDAMPENVEQTIIAQNLKLQTAFVKFGCDFDDNGHCYVTRKAGFAVFGGYNKPELKERNCCSSCVSAVGYIDEWKPVYTAEEKETILKLFNAETGFWRQGRGCVLPRRLMSHICVCFSCHKDLKCKERKKLNDISESLYNIKNIPSPQPVR